MFVSVGAIVAQAPPPVAEPPANVTTTGAWPAQAPPVTDQEQQTYLLLSLRAQVQLEMIQSMNKELDSTNAEIGRLVQRLQDNGKYVVQRDPQTGRLSRVLAAQK
jgi:hypothetical protein